MMRRSAAALVTEARRLVWDNPTARGVVFLAVTYPVAALLAPREGR